MARKIKFALEMKDGVEVRRNLEELREHFDMEKVVGHFLSGKLVKWLEDRYYDDEVAKINQLNKDDPNFHKQLCTALGVEYTDGEDLDVEQLERLNEKRRILQEMTDDEEIIAHAAETALNQEDLADLLDMDTPTIYLCGEKFNVPIRVPNKKYIGILGTPNVTISANSKADTDAKKIFFENVHLPWSVEEKISTDKNESFQCVNFSNSSIKQELMQNYKDIFGDNVVWELYSMEDHYFVDLQLSSSDAESYKVKDIKPTDKRLFLKKIGLGADDEDKLIHVRALANRSAGWAFTTEGFHTIISRHYNGSYASLHAIINKNDFPSFYDKNGNVTPPAGYEVVGQNNETGEALLSTDYIKYENISHVEIVKEPLWVSYKKTLTIIDKNGITFEHDTGFEKDIEDKMADFLELAKEIVK